jgi:hypothetical protein
MHAQIVRLSRGFNYKQQETAIPEFPAAQKPPAQPIATCRIFTYSVHYLSGLYEWEVTDYPSGYILRRAPYVSNMYVRTWLVSVSGGHFEEPGKPGI